MQDSTRTFTWSQVVAEWRWVVADFHAVYHVDLAERWRAVSWVWFEPRLAGLLQTDSLLRKALMPRR